MGIIKEFKDFAVKGNMVDLAVGIILGSAFGKVVSGLVEQIIMPPIGVLIGGVDFTSLKWVIKAATESQPEVSIGIGIWVQALFNFLIVSLTLFFVIRAMNNLKREDSKADVKTETPPPPAEDILLLKEIRDILSKKN